MGTGGVFAACLCESPCEDPFHFWRWRSGWQVRRCTGVPPRPRRRGMDPTILPAARRAPAGRRDPSGASGTASACSAMAAGQGASLNGYRPFPSDNAWNKDISTAAVDANSAAHHQFHRNRNPRAS